MRGPISVKMKELWKRNDFLTSITAAFKIIKSWLPEAGVRKIKVVNKQTVGDYVQEESRPVEWGGHDTWEFEWVPGQFDGVKMPPTLYKVRASVVHWPALLLRLVASLLLVDHLDLANAGLWQPALSDL